MKELIGQCAVWGALEEQMQVLEYMPTGHTNEDSLKNCRLLPEYNEVTGSDYFHAIYRGAEITYCDLCLRWRRTTWIRTDRDHLLQWRGHSILPYLTFKVSIFCYFNY